MRAPEYIGDVNTRDAARGRIGYYNCLGSQQHLEIFLAYLMSSFEPYMPPPLPIKLCAMSIVVPGTTLPSANT